MDSNSNRLEFENGGFQRIFGCWSNRSPEKADRSGRP